MSNKPLFNALLALATVSVAANSWAAAEPAISVGELSAVQSQTILLKAKGERAKAMREADGEVVPQVAVPALQQPYSAAMPQVVSEVSPGQQLPVVKLVYGSGKALHATLLYAGGYEVDASKGSAELPGGWRLAELSVDQVVLERGGKRYPLGFSNRAPAYPISAASSGMPGTTPSLMPMQISAPPALSSPAP